MNFLSITQRLWLEAGASGVSPGPSTTVNQTGEFARLVTWVNSAWNEIQSHHPDWGWLRNSASFATVDSQGAYELGTGAGTVGVAVANFGMWVPGTTRNYITATGLPSEVFMGDDISYDEWRDQYFYGALRTSPTRPMVAAVSPTKALCLGPVALAGYTITRDYFAAPTAMVADADVPALPAQFHEVIMWRALMLYGGFEGAADAYDRGKENHDKLMARLEADRLPGVQTAGPLA